MSEAAKKEAELQARLTAREGKVAELRTSLSERKRALLDRLVEGRAGAAPRRAAIPRRPAPGPAVLSFAQERLWFHDRLEPDSPLYNLPAALRLDGRLEVGALARSLSEIVRRHEALRTVFDAIDGEPRQVVSSAALIPLPIVDLRGLPATHREAEARQLAVAESLRPFDLARGPLLRTALLRLDGTAWLALFNLHHIVGDGWSIGLLIGELAALYRAFVEGGSEGAGSPLPELPIQYADFAAWQRAWLDGEVLAGELAHWRRELDGAPDLLELPADRPRPQVQTFRGGALRFTLPRPLAAALAACAEREGATLFMVLLAGFQAVLGRWTGQDDLLVGSAVANRNRPEVEPLIGFFINLLVLRGRLAGEPSVRQLLGRTREAALAAFAHQDLPFDRLVEELRPARSRAHNPLVQAAFVLQNAPREALELPGLTLRQLALPVTTAKFDLGLEVTELGGELVCQLEYAADLFDPATAARLAGHFERLLAGFVEQPERRLPDVPLLAAAERHQLQVEWGGAAGRPGEREPVWKAIAAQARRRPDIVALELAGGSQPSLTYAGLDLRARRLAGRLRRLGVGPEVRIGLLAERSLDLAAAILGIWQAGGVFLPLDPGLPDARLAFLIEDALAGAGAVLLAQEALRERLRGLPVDAVQVIFLEEDGDGEAEPAGIGAFDPPGAGPEDLAYLIYTSGTTGRPKAVAVEHGSLSHTLAATAAAFGFQPADRMPCLAPFSFDIFLFELLGPLLAGATVVLFPLRPTLDVRALAAAVPECTALHAVPALMREVVEAVAESDGGVAPALRLAFVGGDAVPPELLTDMRRVFPAARVVVLYGPTEGTILASSHEAVSAASAVSDIAARLPIGRPLPGTRLRVLGRGGAPAPIGVPGELHVGGRGVARGYLGRPELTAERFVPLPGAGDRWYRTGDLTRFRPDGSLEFLGRIDHQVKVRGFRIELGEIESVLQEQPEVRAAAVAAREQPGTGTPWLVAYLVFAPEAQAPTFAELRGRLAVRLPDYMVPARFVALPALPLTSTGKVDRRALPAPEPGRREERGETAQGMSPTEELLAALWARLLGVERVEAHDDFFDLGGHSLLATRLLSRVREAFGVEVPIRALFDAPTVAGLAAYLAAESGATAARGAAAAPLRPVPRPELPETGLPLSFAQERLWFLDRLEPGGSVYNIPAAVHLTGPLDVAACGAALDEVVRRHEALRTGFREGREGRPVQVIEPWSPLGLPAVDLSALSGEGTREAREAEVRRLVRAEAGRPFDLAAGRPLRAAVLRLDAAAAEHVLLLTVHHIAADGWSVGILVRELAVLYGAFRAGRPAAAAALPELPVQYADFAAWQREWLSGAALAAQTAFWRRALAEAPTLDLPTDRPRPAVRSPRGARQGVALPPALAEDLEGLARGQGATPFMVLLAGFEALLARLGDQDDLLVGTPIAHRAHREIEGLIGFFVNTLVLRADLAGDPDVAELLRRTREVTLAAYAHQDLPFEKLVEELAPARDASRTPLFEVMFALREAVSGPAGALPLFGDLAAEILEAAGETVKFDLSLTLGRTGEGGYAGSLEYSTDLFDAPTVARLAGQLETLLAGAAAAPVGRSLWQLPLLTPAERAALLWEWNDDGFPAGARSYVLDRRGELVPPGVPGELVIGDGLGTGAAAHGDLGLRTGDLARRRPDGRLEILGRVEDQVKSRRPGRVRAAAWAREARLPGALPRTPAEELLVDLWAGLLGLDQVGIHDNFFDLGGHSLLATRLVARMREVFGVELPVRAVFDAPTVAGLAGLLAVETGEAPPLLRPVARAGELPLSFAQERLWFLDQLEPGGSVYNIPAAVRLTGPLDAAAFGAALDEVVRRHEALRTGFREGSGGRPVQEIVPWSPAGLPVADLSALPGGGASPAHEAEVRRLAREEAGRPFDLAAGRPLRGALLRLAAGATEHVLLLTVHHIASDGWSVGILVGELAALYGAFRAGRPAAAAALPELPVQYADFAVWQRAWLSGAALEAQMDHWRRALAGAATLELPTDRPRPAVRNPRGDRREVALPPGLADDLRRLARGQGATPFMVLLAAFEVFLGRLSGQEDVLVGTPIANRTHHEIEGLIGFFVNTLVLRGDLSGDPDFLTLVRRTREVTLAAYAHQDLPFEKLVEELAPARDASRTPLFQVMFTLQDSAPEAEAAGLGDLAAEALEVASETAKFDLGLALARAADGGFGGALEYSVDLFDALTVARLAGRFEILLAAAAATPGRRIWELPLLAPAERAVLLLEWNDTRLESRQRPVASVPRAIEEQARRRPDAAAVAAPEGLLSYGELNRRANRLAWRLRSLGVGPEVPVAVCAGRSAGLVVGLLAILKAGGAYVPLDPAHPAARLALVLADIAAGIARPVVLVQESLRQRLPEEPEGRRVVLALDSLGSLAPLAPLAPLDSAGAPEREDDPPLPPLEETASPRAYVIYTSGSTGTPKGVEVGHAALANLISCHREAFQTSPGDRYTQLSNPTFDGTAWEIWGCLAAGATLVVPDEATRAAPDKLIAWLAAESITVTFQTTALAVAVLAQAGATWPSGWPPGTALRAFHTGGESLHRAPRDLPFQLINLYGPTECTVLTTTAVVPGGDAAPAIGRPIANARVYVLDRRGELVPPGLPGELVIGGAGVARGYLRRPARTAESFVPDALGGEPGARLYRTGDLGRWRPDGQLEFLGRFDDQVKIRGFRIELGEVEAALVAHAGVQEAAVVVRGEGGETARLVAYVVPRDPDALAVADLRIHLQTRLPEFMVPASFLLLPALPLTANGKVDRRALPAPEPGRGEEGEVAPRTQIEELLAGLWAGLLGLDRVGVHDDFFELGGHSLLATRVVSRVREVFGVELPVRALFDTPTVAGLARRLATGSAEALPPPLAQAPRDRELPLSFAQERLWFLDRLEPGGSAYNIAAAVRLAGPLDVAAFAAALGEVVRRHEALRTGFREGLAGKPVQVIEAWSPAVLPVIDLSALPDGAGEVAVRRLAGEEAGRPFDLAAGRPLRAALLRAGRPAGHVLLVTVHHIAADGWSVGVLVRELAALYGAFRAGRTAPADALTELPVQYADFAVWQRAWLSGAALEAQASYWRQALAGAPALELPTDRPRPAVRSSRGAARRVTLPPGLSEDLRRLARAQGATPFMVLLAAFQALLGRLGGQEDVLVGTPIANRTHQQIEGLIGFFVNTLVLRGDLAGGPDLPALLGRIREATLRAYAHQDLPFEKLVEELAPVRDASRTPLFQVMFTLDDALPAPPAFADLAAEPLEVEAATAKFDLTLSLGRGETGAFVGDIEYATDLFDAATVLRLAGQLETLLAAAVGDGAAAGWRLADLPLLTAAERHQLQIEWNATRNAAGPGGATLLERIAEQAARTPDAVAVVQGEARLTYGELAARASQVGRRLWRPAAGQETGLENGAGFRVGLSLERSPELVVGLLGILAAGGTYVPIDPAYPAERRDFMRQDAGLADVVDGAWLAAALGRASAVPRAPGKLAPPLLSGREKSGPSSEVPLYVIFTSGSTGRPKGAVVRQGAFAVLVDWYVDELGLNAADRHLLLSSASFDLTQKNFFAPLLVGAELHLAPSLYDPVELRELVERHAITGLNCTPSAFYPLVENGEEGDPAALASLRTVVLGGEPIALGRLDRWRRSATCWATVINSYGPTECTDVVAFHRLAPPDGTASIAPVPLGRPISGARLWIAGASSSEPAPIGVPGELWIGGGCVGGGYLGDAARTALQFLPDPYPDMPGVRAYRTGDLARRLSSGEIEYLGRIDHQVKVRGFRIELGEIEAALADQPGVREAVVVAREVRPERPEDLRLAAYVVPGEAAPASGELIADLRRALARRLPPALLPSAFVVLAALPLTPSGKVDRRALPAPGVGGESDVDRLDFVGPRTPVEELLAGIWCELLHVERVGARDDFFALGGHSLLATQLASRLRAAFGVEVPLRRIFDAPTLEGLAVEIAAARQGGADAEEPPLLPAARGLRLPLSFAQERLWFLERFDPGNPSLNIPLAVELVGRLAVPALAAALAGLAERHESLRTTFETIAGEPSQTVHPAAPVGLPEIDLAALPAEAAGREAERLTGEQALHGFDLERGPLWRSALVRLAGDRHQFLLVLHHIITDGWSMGVLLRELGAVYEALSQARRPALPPLPVQYADFAVWQRRILAGERREDLDHWLARLGGEIQPLELPTDRPRPAVQTFRGARWPLVLPADLSARLRAFGRREGVTLFMTLLAAANALLRRQSGQDDVLIGTPIAGRRRLETEGLIGFFLNTLVLRTDLAGDPSLRTLAGRVRDVTLDAFAHQDVPFEAVLAGLKGERDLSRTPLFQVLFNMLNLPRGEVRLPGLTLTPLAGPEEVPSKFDLTFYVTDHGAEIGADLVYNADLFDEARMADLADQYAGLLAQAVADPDAPLVSLSLVTERARAVLPEPRAALGTAWVGAVHELFGEQARRAPERTAVSDGDGAWSYGDLDEASGRLAAWLLARGVAREDRVAIWAHRSAPLVPAVLAALRAGAAFTMLDPAYPAARLVGMLTLASPRACLLVGAAGPLPAEVEAWLEAADCPRLLLPGGGPGAFVGLSDLPTEKRSMAVGPDDLAYVAFTSGSTGTPKGILGRHGPLTHFLPWMCGRFGLSAEDRFTLLSGLAHDPLQRDLFTPLCLGATIVIPDPDDIPVPGRIAAWLARAGATVAHLTPAMAQLVTESTAGDREGDAARVSSLRLALLVGEALTRQDVARLRRLAPRVTCVNLFGSTETQRAVAFHAATAEEASGRGRGHQVLALGRGMEDVQLLVLTPAGGLAGIGEVGEIAVRSPHLARGYLHDPGLTAARFRPNPAGGVSGDRLYRTGDLGRYLPDGEVVFAGRGDSQVKIRGFRVEPAEIEAALARHPAVAAAAALLHDAEDARGERFLVALVVPRPGAEPSPAELREHLLRELPPYMVPAAFARVAALPLTPNGKLDRRALPRLVPARAEMVGERSAAAAAAAAPRDPAEELLAGLWAGLLGLERVGIHDNFFALGGHSLLATRLVSRIREVFGVELPVRALFDAPTVAGLAALLAQGSGEAPPPPLRPMPRRELSDTGLALSFAQERMWLLDRLAPGGSAYNIGAAVRLAGPLDPAAFRSALGEVVRRHESLRTGFREGAAGGPVQVIEPWRPIALPVVDLSGLPGKVRETSVLRLARAEMARPFDLAAGQPLRAALLKLSLPGKGRAAEHVLLLTVHHIAADGWSIGLLVGELGALYGGFRASRAGRPALGALLPELPVQYADFAVWQREWLSGAVLDNQMAYWRQALAGAPNLELPTDRPRPAVRGPRGARRRAALPAGLSEDLRRLASAQGATPFMVLLAAFEVLLGRSSGQDDVLVGTPIANRTQRAVEGLIGFFANTLVLRGDLAGDPGFLTLLGRTREATLAAYEHQDLPFEKLVGELAPARDVSRTPLFQVMFVLQNADSGGEAAAGLESGFGDLTAEWLQVAGETSKFDLTLSLGVGEGGAYAGAVEHSTDLFDGATIERLLGQLGTLLAGVVADPETRLSDLPLLTAPERQALLEWNATTAALPGGDACLHELVAAQVARTPDAVAVAFEGEALSYHELAARSGLLARHLRRLGVGPEVTVGVCLERSLELVVGLLGVLEAGGAYLPLDPSYPRERLAFMLEDGCPPVVLATADTAAVLPPHAGRTVLLDGPLPALPEEGAEEPAAALRATPENLAYVIFTSGSTGRPKGVMVRHRSIVNRVLWTLREFPLAAGDRLLHKTPFSFDASIWEIFAPLWRGAVLVVASPGGHQDTAYMAAALAAEAITVLQAVPSLLRVLLDEPSITAATGLRRVFCGGEALAGDLVARCHELLPAAVTNLYGPTEVAIDASFWRCERGAPAAAVIPIGRPIANDRVDLVDAHGRLVPVGVAGELRVGGVGLARGYVGRPDLTAERFVPDPAAGKSAEPGARLYLTGDLARRLPGGEIEYLGRIDHQVKIRGFRIELGEIEAALATDSTVAESVVVARAAGQDGGGNLQLVAYVVPRGEALSLPDLRAGLTGRLPYYMLPAAFVVLPALPRTPNGKLDRRALPSPDLSPDRETGFEAPRSGVEERLAAVWIEVLGERAERLGGGVSRHDNFFALGGDSLLAIRIVNRAREAGLVFTPLQLFERQTIAELSELPGILAEPVVAAPEQDGETLAVPESGPDLSGADFDQDELARFLAGLTGG